MAVTKQVLFYIYSDHLDREGHEPYIINNPPDNLGELLRQWNGLDERMNLEALLNNEEWLPVQEWLTTQGVDIVEAENIIMLDDYPPDGNDEEETR